MKKTVFFAALALMSSICTAQIPSIDTAQQITNRLVLLYETTNLPNFKQLNDEILDNTAKSWFLFSNQVKVIHKNEQPQLFKQDKADYSVAIRKQDAANLALFFFGRPARLLNEPEYLYGEIADGVPLCESKITKITAQNKNRALIDAELWCSDSSGEESKNKQGSIRLEVKPSATFPTGWEVVSWQLK